MLYNIIIVTWFPQYAHNDYPLLYILTIEHAAINQKTDVEGCGFVMSIQITSVAVHGY